MFSRTHTKSSKRSVDARAWRRFSLSAPAPGALIEIRRANDDKTILRRRADLPPTFAFHKAEWRALF